MTYIIAEPCVDVKDKSCVDECPVDCIYEGERMLYIHPDECVDCGACEPVCPVEAIFYEDDVPEQWSIYYDVNVDYFDDLGSRGGAEKIGMIEKDHEVVATLPPMADDLRGVRSVRRGLPLGRADPLPGNGGGAPRGRGRPFDRHPRRPHPASRAAGACIRGERPGLSHGRGDPGTAPRPHQLVGAAALGPPHGVRGPRNHRFQRTRRPPAVA